jgi:hypothetical protein
MKFASVNFHKSVKVPNSESAVTGCFAVGNISNKDGLVLDYDEEYGMLRISAKKPRTAKDKPRCVFRENISDFVLLEDDGDPTKPPQTKKPEEPQK